MRATSGRWTPAALLTALTAGLAVAVLLSLALGARPVAPGAVLDALVRPGGALPASPDADTVVVRELRLPRTVVGLLVGAALGVAGAVVQTVTRNPLADPGLLGVNAGAALGVVLSIWLWDAASLTSWVWFALAGAAAATVAVHLLSGAGAAATPVRLVVTGATVTGLLAALTNAVVLADRATLDRFRFWLVGSLSGRTADVAVQVAPFVVAGLLLVAVLAGRLDALALGDDVAHALGVPVRATRVLAAAAVVLLCGAATAAAGPLAFVGLVVPHLLRGRTGPGLRRLLPAAALGGAVLLLLADVVARLVLSPAEVPVGVAVALVGGPVFVLLARRGPQVVP